MKLMQSAGCFVVMMIAGSATAGAQPSTQLAGSAGTFTHADSTYAVHSARPARSAGLAPGVYLGVKTGASTHVGGAGASAQPIFPALAGELAYQLTRWLGFGVAYQYASSLGHDLTEDARRTAHASIRGMLPREHLSPYLQVGAHRLFGRTDESYGVDVSLGIEWKVAQRISIYPEIAFNVVPSNAAGAARTGRMGSIGIGMRASLFRGYHPAVVQEIIGPALIRAREPASFRAGTAENAAQPVSYAWRVGGDVLQGNPVEVSFRQPGRYDVTLETSNRAGARRTLLSVDVLPAEPSDAAVSAALTRSDQRGGGDPVRIVGVYGPTVMRVGEDADFRARNAPGAEQPVIYRWDMGDGTPAIGNNITHHYAHPGRYVAVVTAQNKKGSDSDSLVIVVREVAAPPVPHIEATTSTAPTEPAAASTGGERPKRDTSLRGSAPLDWSRGGFTLHVATSSTRPEAESYATNLRRNGFRTGIYKDDSGRGSAVYRVVIGQFADERQAVAARQQLLGEGRKGAFIVQRLPSGNDGRP